MTNRFYAQPILHHRPINDCFSPSNQEVVSQHPSVLIHANWLFIDLLKRYALTLINTQSQRHQFKFRLFLIPHFGFLTQGKEEKDYFSFFFFLGLGRHLRFGELVLINTGMN